MMSNNQSALSEFGDRVTASGHQLNELGGTEASGNP